MTATNSPYDSALVAGAGLFNNLFGREAVYLPAAGGSRTIKGILSRVGIEPVPGMTVGRTEAFLFSVINSATTGIAESELDTGGDKLRMENPLGGSTQDRRIVGVEKSDAGRLLLQIE